MTSTTSNTVMLHKKARTDADQDADDDNNNKGFAAVRSYLLQCPHVPSDHPAVKAALAGLDAELQRRRRDAKLQDKFLLNDAVSVEKPTEASDEEKQAAEASLNKKKDESMLLDSTTDEAMMTDDWQDVVEDDEDNDSCSSALAKQVISLLAQHDVCVRSPLAAVAVALHAALVALNFKCTGVPEQSCKSSNSSGGFAAPIRELPASQLLPNHWQTKNKVDDAITLRYRKQETGSVLLTVQVLVRQPSDGGSGSVAPVAADANDSVVEVCLFPANHTPTMSEPRLEVRLGDHVNLESLGRALGSNSTSTTTAGNKDGVSPALHYKSLSGLLARFAATFDLGGVAETTASASSQPLPYVDTTIRAMPTTSTMNSNVQQPHQPNPGLPVTGIPATGYDRWSPQQQRPRDEVNPPLIHQEFPTGGTLYPPHGDFSDDLLPSGIPPFLGGGGGMGMGGGRPDHMGGNLMGPNHPMFHGSGSGPSGIAGVGSSSGFGMRPRFDPFGPPGGPTETDDDNTKNGKNLPRRPGGSGNPNRDDMRRPNDLNNNNMFL